MARRPACQIKYTGWFGLALAYAMSALEGLRVVLPYTAEESHRSECRQHDSPDKSFHSRPFLFPAPKCGLCRFCAKHYSTDSATESKRIRIGACGVVEKVYHIGL